MYLRFPESGDSRRMCGQTEKGDAVIKLAVMTSVCPDWTVEEIIRGMKRHGYQGLEPRVEWNHRAGIELELSPDERRKLREMFEDEGLRICCISTGVRMAVPDRAERQGQIDSLHRYIDLASDLGAGLVRTFGGPRARDMELRGVVNYVADGYREVLPHAEERGVTVLMETHDDWSCSNRVREVVETVGHPNLRALWDIMHPARMLERPEETFNTIGEHTGHVHVHDGKYSEDKSHIALCPLGEGDIDHATPIRLLEEAGFDGYLSVEVIHRPGSVYDADGAMEQYAKALCSYLTKA